MVSLSRLASALSSSQQTGITGSNVFRIHRLIFPTSHMAAASLIAYGNGQFVAVGRSVYSLDGRGTTVISADGVNWVPHSAGRGFLFTHIAYGNGQFVASATSSTSPWLLLTSSDGVNWAYGLVDGRAGWFDSGPVIAYGDDQFVAVGTSFPAGMGISIQTSADGTNWVERRSGITDSPQAITYRNGRFVAVGYSGTILTSNDGTNWVQGESGTQNDLLCIASGNGQFVAVGNGILTSTDGVSWVQRQSGTVNLLSGVSYGNGHFVAVGDSGTILESGIIITLALTPSRALDFCRVPCRVQPDWDTRFRPPPI